MLTSRPVSGMAARKNLHYVLAIASVLAAVMTAGKRVRARWPLTTRWPQWWGFYFCRRCIREKETIVVTVYALLLVLLTVDR